MLKIVVYIFLLALHHHLLLLFNLAPLFEFCLKILYLLITRFQYSIFITSIKFIMMA